MIQIEITDSVIIDRPITAKQGGKQYLFREQTAWAHLVGPNGAKDAHPTKCVINIERDAAAYVPGRYSIAPESIYVNKFGAIDIGRLKLKPIAAAAASVKTGT